MQESPKPETCENKTNVGVERNNRAVTSSEGKWTSREGGKIGRLGNCRGGKADRSGRGAYEGLHDPNQRDDPVLRIRRHDFHISDGSSDGETAQPQQLDVGVIRLVALDRGVSISPKIVLCASERMILDSPCLQGDYSPKGAEDED